MNFVNRNKTNANQDIVFDQRFKSYMVGVYANMGIGLLITALTAYITAMSPQMMNAIFKTPLYYIVLFAPLGMAFYYSFNWMKIRTETAQGLFFLYALMVGLSLSSLFIVYTGESIVRVFLITSSMFGAISVYGYTTKRDLTAMASFLMMGLFGLIIAMLVNMFFQSSAFQTGLSFIAVILFTGLTAYDVQRLKTVYYQVNDSEMISKVAMFGAFILYLDFINLFIHLMHLLGNQRRS